LVLLSGCAAQQAEMENGVAASAELPDPIEPVNRFFFDVNEFLDTLILRPLAEIYLNVFPPTVRESVRNFLLNLGAPVTLANDILQGENKRADVTFNRFVINTTLGVAGLFDPATGMGYPHHREDFGQTLAVHGADRGFYLVLPLLGPSSSRDAIGILVDILFSPLTYVSLFVDTGFALYGLRGLNAVDTRSRHIEDLDELKREALDFYVLMRSVYQQRRQFEIRNGRPADGAP